MPRSILYMVPVVLLAASAPASAPAFGQPAPAGSAADRALKDDMATMTSTMKTQATGDADRDFVTMMIPHHQGAIDMAKTELRYGRDPAIRTLAQAIVAAQEHEIAEMKAWLAARPH